MVNQLELNSIYVNSCWGKLLNEGSGEKGGTEKGENSIKIGLRLRLPAALRGKIDLKGGKGEVGLMID